MRALSIGDFQTEKISRYFSSVVSEVKHGVRGGQYYNTMTVWICQPLRLKKWQTIKGIFQPSARLFLSLVCLDLEAKKTAKMCQNLSQTTKNRPIVCGRSEKII